jgi:ABC-2 type transport system permease protein
LVGVSIIVRKELSDSVSNRAFLISLVVLVVSMVIAGISAGDTYRLGLYQTDVGWYSSKFFDLLIINNQVTLVNSLGVLIAVAYGFSTINKERNEGSLKVLLSYPIFRDQIIVGKLLSGFIIITIITVVSLSVGLVTFLLSANLIPNVDMIARFSTYVLLSIILLGGWLGLSVFLSSFFKDTKTTLLVLLLLVGISNSEALSYFANVVPRAIFGSLYTNNPANYQAMLLMRFINNLSPSTSYSLISLNLSFFTMFTFVENERVFIPTIITDVLINNIYSLVLLVVIPIITFAASYVVFMRRDIS